jgi:VWFA-related protein
MIGKVVLGTFTLAGWICAQVPSGEMATHDEPASFRSRVNLVLVPVVVRNAQGMALGNLTKESFQLFDKGKPQEISRFTVEKAGQRAVQETKASTPPGGATETPVILPDRFVAYYFDDLHLNQADLPRVRDAAHRHIGELQPSDRAAIYTMSGSVNVDFTDDKSKLSDALLHLRPALMTRVGALTDVEQNTLASLRNLRDIVQRMATAPGQRTIMMISPGFFTYNAEYQSYKSDVLERAIRANVIINALDARGLYTDPMFDVTSNGRGRGGLFAATARADILAEMAYGTGGNFYQNSNDMDEGFRRLASSPEYVYVLGFAPQNLKSDGSFHGLKVTLKGVGGVSVQARHGYYAPRRQDDAAETARQEIEAALFSREEMSELPIDVHTQYFKASDRAARLTVMAHLDLKHFKLRKAEGRNRNDVTLVYGIFDRNGNYLQGVRKLLELRLKDETVERLTNGVNLRTSFDVAPGVFLVRLVVRDAEGQMMSAANAAVEIP